MSPISLEIRKISCKDLKAFNFFQKLTVHATVSIVTESDHNKKRIHQQQKTSVDKEGDGNPEWKEEEINFNLKEIISSSSSSKFELIFLQFHMICEGIIFGNKTIGEVRVPFKDLVHEYNGAVRFISYQVKGLDGNANGVLNFSYKVLDDGNNLYPKIDMTDLQTNSGVYQTISPSYPPPENYYPAADAPAPDNYYPRPGVYYPVPEVYCTAAPPVPVLDVCCAAPPPQGYPVQEVCCTAAPQVYLPPPRPPQHPPTEMGLYPPPQGMGYHPGMGYQPVPPAAPSPYGFGYGDYGYPMCAYATVDHVHHQFDGDRWPKGEEYTSASWNVR